MTSSWWKEKLKYARFSPRAILGSVVLWVFISLLIANASWDEIRPLLAIWAGTIAAAWFLNTFCKDYDK
jgi:hypothetical protein